jgi:ribose/xylose/arabinose/galactoside ABC-type transport system permease subunit
MAYDDSRFRGEPGFRDEPDFRSDNGLSESTTLRGGPGDAMYSPGSYSVPGYSDGPESTDGTLSLSRRVSQAQLDDVFDDPEHGDPGRDRMGIHVVWELLLVLAVAGVYYLLFRGHRAAVSGASLRELMVSVAALGFITLGMGLSLRAAAPNLAVGPIAFGSGVYFADHLGRGTVTTAAVTALLALVAGVVLAVVVVGFHVPGWAASLAMVLGLMVWINKHLDPKPLQGAYQPNRHGMYWLAGFAVIGLVGALLGAVKPIRRAIGRFRSVSDPAKRRGATAATLTALALVGSCLLASLGGILLALQARGIPAGDSGLTLTGLALGAALLGGTSIFGRRGGVFGTVLAVALVVLVIGYADITDRRVAPLAFAALAIGLGLVVTRLIEAFGRPQSVIDDEADRSWQANAASSNSDIGWSSRQSGWTSPLPARSGDDGWGVEDRWGSR